MTWKTVKLGEVCETITKGTTPTSVGYKFQQEGINFVKIESISASGNFIISKFAKVSTDCNNALRRSQLKSGDILFSIAGALGRTAIVTDDILPANTNQALAIIRLSQDLSLDLRYILYALNSDSVKVQSEMNRGGVAQQNLSLTQLKNYDIPLPPLAEQERIVAKLDAAFAAINHSIILEDKKEAEVMKLVNSFIKSSLDNDIYNWNFKTLPEIAKNLDSKRVPITKSKRTKGEIPYYGASGVVDHVEGFIFNEDLLLISEDGANLLQRTYPVAFSVSGKTWVNNHAHVLRFSNSSLQRWVQFYINSVSLGDYISGMAQPKLNQKRLNQIPIPCPSSEMLDELTTSLQSLQTSSAEVAYWCRSKKNNLYLLKAAILAQEVKIKESEAA